MFAIARNIRGAFRVVATIRAVAAGLMIAGTMTVCVGRTINWAAPAPLNSYASMESPSDDIRPVVATDGSGNWVSIWGNANGLYSARSIDAGATWSPAIQVITSTPPPTVFDESSPTPVNIDYTGDRFIAHWHTFFYHFLSWIPTYNTYRSTSLDGLTWSEPEIIRNFFVADTKSDGAGTIVVVGTTTTPFSSPQEEYVLQSSDNGDTWTSRTIATVTIWGGFVMHLGNSKWAVVVQRDWYESTDNGNTWSAPRDISSDVDPIYDIEAYGNLVVAANYPKFSVSNDGGLTWQSYGTPLGRGFNQRLSVDNSGNWLLVMHVLPDKRNPAYDELGVIVTTRSSNPTAGWSALEKAFTNPIKYADNAVAAGTGNGDFMIVFQSYMKQTLSFGPDRDIEAIHSTDAGVTWSAPTYVNDYHADDFLKIDDFSPQIVKGDNETVIAAWVANTSFDPNGRNHIMFARSDDFGATWSSSAPATPPFGTYDIDVDSFELVYAGQGRWMIWWTPGRGTTLPSYFGDYIVSNDNGLTWSAPQTFFGHAVGASGTGTMVKAHTVTQEPPLYGLARLPAGALYWEEPQLIAGPALTNVVHTSGENWFAVSTEGDLYVSTDDGRTWTHDASAEVPPPGSSYGSNHKGIAMAITVTTSTMNAVKMVTSRTSWDNGATWSEPVNVTTQNLEDVPSPIYADNNTWIIGLYTYISDSTFRRYPQAVITENNGRTWAAPQMVAPDPEQFTDLNPVTAKGNKAIAVWGNGDIYYNLGNLTAPNAAKDWQLFD